MGIFTDFWGNRASYLPLKLAWNLSSFIHLQIHLFILQQILKCLFWARHCCEVEREPSTADDLPLEGHRFLFIWVIFPGDPSVYVWALSSISLIQCCLFCHLIICYLIFFIKNSLSRGIRTSLKVRTVRSQYSIPHSGFGVYVQLDDFVCNGHNGFIPQWSLSTMN